jgi:methionyl-tRNA formyltransferase
VKRAALELGLPPHQPERWKAPDTRELWASLGIDLAVVAAYGHLLPSWMLDSCTLGVWNLHYSLLPRWRGAAPIHRAIEAGDEETGVTIMQMEAGLDTGPMLLKQTLPIGPEETTGSLHDKLALLGAALAVDALGRLPTLQPVVQPGEGVTYASKIDKGEARIDWHLPAPVLARRIRAFNPFPGAVFHQGGLAIKVWRAEPIVLSGTPGEVGAMGPQGIRIACGEGSLLLTEMQKPGGKRLSAADFLRGHPMEVGQRLD